jgi:hypothetical protein
VDPGWAGNGAEAAAAVVPSLQLPEAAGIPYNAAMRRTNKDVDARARRSTYSKVVVEVAVAVDDDDVSGRVDEEEKTVEGGEEAVGVDDVGGVGVVLPHWWARKREVMKEVDTLDRGSFAASAPPQLVVVVRAVRLTVDVDVAVAVAVVGAALRWGKAPFHHLRPGRRPHKAC